MQKPEPTVFVVDDDQAMRHSLVWLIQSVSLKVEAFPSAEAFLAALEPDRPGCLVLDIRMPGMGGLELQRVLRRQGAKLPVIVISGHGDIPTAVRAMKAGALDFIEKPFNDQLLLDRINEAIRKSLQTLEEDAQRREILARLAQLTPRERAVLDRVAAGKQNKVIAVDLGISLKTVEVHRHNAMEKMQERSAAGLARMLTLVGGEAEGEGRP